MDSNKIKFKIKVKNKSKNLERNKLTNNKVFDKTLYLDESIITSLNYILIYQNNQLDNQIKDFIVSYKK